jgi:hypothetical protein
LDPDLPMMVLVQPGWVAPNPLLPKWVAPNSMTELSLKPKFFGVSKLAKARV